MIKTWFLVSLLALGADPSEVAMRYLQALYGQDSATLETVASESLLFHDPTAVELGQGPVRFEGREAVVDFFRASLATVESSRFEVVRRFTAGEKTVLELTYVVRGDGEVFGAAGTDLELHIPGVTVLTVRDGKVLEHQDFIDYRDMLRQVEAQKSGG
ncbi:MAG: nuclear transport factor 2 family protein [Acidobacteriota bacterium]